MSAAGNKKTEIKQPNKKKNKIDELINSSNLFSLFFFFFILINGNQLTERLWRLTLLH